MKTTIRYRKRPVVIDAIQWLGDLEEVFNWMDRTTDGNGTGLTYADDGTGSQLKVHTLEGSLTVSLYDWIICGIEGELYPCKPDIFSKTYDAIEENERGYYT